MNCSFLSRSQDQANRLASILAIARAVVPQPTATVAQAQATQGAESPRGFCATCPLWRAPTNRFDFLANDEAAVWAYLACQNARSINTAGTVCTWMATAVIYSYQGGLAALALAESGQKP